MATMTVSEARAALPEVLDRVAEGEEVTITRHGRAVAVVVHPFRPDHLVEPSRGVEAAQRVGGFHTAPWTTRTRSGSAVMSAASRSSLRRGPLRCREGPALTERRAEELCRDPGRDGAETAR